MLPTQGPHLEAFLSGLHPGALPAPTSTRLSADGHRTPRKHTLSVTFLTCLPSVVIDLQNDQYGFSCYRKRSFYLLNSVFIVDDPSDRLRSGQGLSSPPERAPRAHHLSLPPPAPSAALIMFITKVEDGVGRTFLFSMQ